MVLNQEEQAVLDRIKRFFRTYALFIGIGLFGGTAIIGGWNFYQYYQLGQLENASNIYQRFIQVSNAYNEALSELEVNSLNEDNTDSVDAGTTIGGGTVIGEGTETSGQTALRDINITSDSNLSVDDLPEERALYLKFNLSQLAGVLREDHASTSYAGFAALRVAAVNAMDGETDLAIEQLTWVFRSSDSTEISRMAGLLLGQILTSVDRHEEALTILKTSKMRSALSSLVSELRGDILSKQGNYEEAVAAYEEALKRGGDLAGINYKISILPL